jgi:hypothetical protein
VLRLPNVRDTTNNNRPNGVVLGPAGRDRYPVARDVPNISSRVTGSRLRSLIKACS